MNPITIPENLPIGVSKAVYDWVDTLEIKKPRIPLSFIDHIQMSGITVFLDHNYPMTLEDGTIIHGCMLGAHGSRYWIVTEPPQKASPPRLKERGRGVK